MTVVYDGKPHGLSINKELPVGTTVEYPNGEEFTEAGTYQITWNISKETYASISLTGNLKITQAEYDMNEVVLEDVTIDYDGNVYAPEKPDSPHYNSVFDKLPEGVTVKQVTSKIKVGEDWNDYSDSLAGTYPDILGEYQLTISYNYDAKNYLAVQNMEYNLTIKQKVIDLSGVVFQDVVIEKTQEEMQALRDNNQKLTVSVDPATLPEGVTVTYLYKLNDAPVSDDGVNSFGVYQVIATFIPTDPNWALSVTSLTITFEIKEAGGQQ